jgi:hypothetical protein
VLLPRKLLIFQIVKICPFSGIFFSLIFKQKFLAA